MIGKLLGHARAQMTACYAHLARDSVKEEAARISASIGEDILRKHAVPETARRYCVVHPMDSVA